MKRILLLFIALVTVVANYAQDNTSKISINAWVDEEDVAKEAARYLDNKLQQWIADNGFADNDVFDRFVLAAKIDIVQKNITPTAPIRVSTKMDITLFVGDIVENKQYASCSMQVSAIGTNDIKAYINAFRKIDTQQKRIQTMLNNAKAKIVDYYTYHCAEIKTRANGLAVRQQYDEAISFLTSVPNICSDCFMQCQAQAITIYRQKINTEAVALLNQAKGVWATNKSKEGAMEVANIIAGINPQAANYSEVNKLRNEIASHLQAEEKQAWNMLMQQQAHEQQKELKAIEAARAIGVAWAKNRPKTIYRTIIYGW